MGKLSPNASQTDGQLEAQLLNFRFQWRHLSLFDNLADKRPPAGEENNANQSINLITRNATRQDSVLFSLLLPLSLSAAVAASDSAIISPLHYSSPHTSGVCGGWRSLFHLPPSDFIGGPKSRRFLPVSQNNRSTDWQRDLCTLMSPARRVCGLRRRVL